MLQSRLPRVGGWLLAAISVILPVVALAQTATKPAATASAEGTRPVVVVETAKGSFEFELYPDDAPTSVKHILALVKRNFYNGQRVHRVEPALIQFGDPKSRDMTKRDQWGQTAGGGSGKPIGVAEISKQYLHVKGAVGLAYAGDATKADSQIYIGKRDLPSLNGKYAVIGKVISGMDVVEKITVEDVIKRVSVK